MVITDGEEAVCFENFVKTSADTHLRVDGGQLRRKIDDCSGTYPRPTGKGKHVKRMKMRNARVVTTSNIS